MKLKLDEYNSKNKSLTKEELMKRFTVLFAVIALLMAGSAYAQSDNHTVTVGVQSVQRLDVDVDVSITVDDADADDAYDLPATDNSATLSYAHNGAAAKKITVLASGTVSSNDMTITVGDGTTTVTLVNGGTIQAAGDLISGISGGSDTAGLTYSVTSATLGGTPVGNYAYTVTYTLTNP